MTHGRKPNEHDTLAHIRDLVAQEKTLRTQLQQGEISTTEEHERLQRIEIELDQCWDLLRQRRALRETGGDPREAAVRPADEVEGYTG
ncbi:hypothetical protein Mkiyose1665_25840 [Mycobacterium kiyosense]|uniref:DUF2630 family protein n=1 Tax=Mycobacterium kiyosense TaxID=2871094 RepID=A0A9P3Q588_9MYCO|nr:MULTISPECIES: DUF2630 family protein [Mycobacterium]BDE16361.1 hypothetical protein MKCMC460_52210 [Mycobacterium sp. 20KCMC460]GLB82837.1 hypothetical protein SRL2020028_20930 [Mycobacterium kiyosense]GLB94923.1 hypothetical protein SRL2020226_16990 [Mycobacterium kiyosense]GLC00416.1 hypothetical protein SRL2020400_10070 [Mycobacterium kiyosense]GLC07497.1 hypothetical protein SRL2020411_21430 [Mycobacterium kiyosense]